MHVPYTGRVTRGVLTTLATAVCAGPSLFAAVEEPLDTRAIIVGMSIVLGSAFCISASEPIAWLMRLPRWRAALFRAVLSRLVVLLVCPLGLTCDFLLADFAARVVGFEMQFDEYNPPIAVDFPQSLGAILLRAAFFPFEILTWTLFWALIWKREPSIGNLYCEKCGYDLRGSLEFGRCPECGTAFVS